MNPQTTNITYKIDDGTGTIEVKKWIDADKRDDDVMEGGTNGAAGGVELDQYVRVWGRLRPFNNKRHVVAHFLRVVEDFNEVNYHLLESTYVHLYLTKGGPPGGAKAEGGDGMFVGNGADNYRSDGPANESNAKLAGLGPEAKKMFAWFKHAEGGNEGVHFNIIASGAKMTTNEVLKGADELLGVGLIYPTVDDETWAVLDY